MNFIVKNSFISSKQKASISSWAESYKSSNKTIENEHIKTINEAINGYSILYDITKTTISKHISLFQGDNTVVPEIPNEIKKIGDNIASSLKLSKAHTFVQFISMNEGGEVKKHYDASIPDYITYKCNIVIDGPQNDSVFVGKNVLKVNPCDLYCFEASLYKHWLEKSNSKRSLLSYGFILPIESLGYKKEDPIIRLSERIWKTFINK